MNKTMKVITKTLLCTFIFMLLFTTAVFAEEPAGENSGVEETAIALGRNQTINAVLDADGEVYKVKTAANRKAYYLYIDNPTEDAMSIAVYKKVIDDKKEGGRTVYYAGSNNFNMTLKTDETYYIVVKSEYEFTEGETLNYEIGFYECAKAIKKEKPKGFKVSSKLGHAEILFDNTYRYDGVQIYRSTAKKSGYKKVKTVKCNTFFYSYGDFALADTKVNRGKTYYYKIRYYEKDGNKTYYSKWSAIKKIKIK